ncbi:putative ribonuclease H-like domain-containing protein [Tanacetum coccineum]
MRVYWVGVCDDVEVGGGGGISSCDDDGIMFSLGSQIPDKSRKGLGFVSYNVVPPPPTGLFSPPNLDLSYSGLEEFQQPEFEGYGPKPSKSVSEDTSNEVKESPDAPLVEELVSDDKLEKKTVFPTVAKMEFVRPKQQEKPVRKPVKYAEMYSFDHVQANCNYHQRERVVSGNNYTRVNYNYSAKKTHPSAHRNMVPRAVLMKTGLRSLNTARPVNTAHPKTTVYSARPMPKAVNTARPNSAVVNAVRGKSGEPVLSLRTLRIYEGYVTFGGGAKGGKKLLVWNLKDASKDETNGILKNFISEIENLVDKKVKIIRCDNGTEFKNRIMSEFYEQKGIKWEFSIARTSQQNDNKVFVVNHYNKSLYELFRGKFDGKSDEGFFVGYSLNSKAFRVYNIRTRKVEENLHIRFLEDKPIIAGDGPKWLFDIDVLTKSMNYVPVVAGTNSNDYVDGSLFDSSLKNASNNEPQPSSDAGKKDDEGVCKESGIADQENPKNNTQGVNTVGPCINTKPDMFSLGDNATLEATHADFFGGETKVDMSNITTAYPVPSTPNTRIHKDHSLDHVIRDVQSGVLTRKMIKTTNEQGFISAVYEGKTHEDLHTCLFACFLSQEEPKKVIQALKDPNWIEAMQEELLQFKLQQNDDRCCTGYHSEEGIDYDEVFAARIEAIRLFLAYASFKDFVVYQMDVKSAFLYGKIEEEVYVCQPPGFEDPDFPDRVYKVEKALYGLHQAPRAWYETLSTYLLDNGFQRGKIDKTLFIRRDKGDILLVQVYVDDIIFGSTKKSLCTEFEKMMHKKFQMSSMGELTFFLGLQVKQKEDGIFISQDKYVTEILKKFGFSDVKTASTPMETQKALLKDADGEDVDEHLYRSMIGSLMYLTSSRPDIMFAVCQPKLGLWYPNDSPFDLVAYTNSDYVGASLDRKSTIGGCQFLGCRLISWQCKKQTVVANSTTDAEYIAASNCCGQVLWIQNQLLDYGYNFMQTKIHIDNESTICIVKNLVFHSKTKHIEIRHHFIRDSNEKKLIQMIKIHTDQNVADLLTKAFDVSRFQYLIASIGMLNL